MVSKVTADVYTRRLGSICTLGEQAHHSSQYGAGRSVGVTWDVQANPPKPESAARLCPNCNEKNSPGMRFCGRCGCPLDPAELTRARKLGQA